MSLFIGSIPNDMDPGEFEEMFSKIGSCTCRLKVILILFLNNINRAALASSISMKKSTLRKPSKTSMEPKSRVERSESAGPRRVAEMVAVAVAAETHALTVGRPATCLESARNLASPESLAEAGVAAVTEPASTAANLVT